MASSRWSAHAAVAALKQEPTAVTCPLTVAHPGGRGVDFLTRDWTRGQRGGNRGDSSTWRGGGWARGGDGGGKYSWKRGGPGNWRGPYRGGRSGRGRRDRPY